MPTLLLNNALKAQRNTAYQKLSHALDSNKCLAQQKITE